MKYTIILYLIVFPSFIFPCKGQITIGKNSITIGNEVIQKDFFVSKTGPDRIMITALVDKTHKRELLQPVNTSPWFEFVIDHRLVTSSDRLWRFLDFTERKLSNQGTEYTLNFEGVVSPAKGLLVSVKEQLFPQSSLVREKLILHTKGNTTFTLNKQENKLHFIFPRYTYNVGHLPAKSKEIEIATWDGEVLDSMFDFSYDSRLFDNTRYGGDHNLSQAHMFHPKVVKRKLYNDTVVSMKGPLALISNGSYTFLTAYEHASQDNMVIKQPYDNLDFLHIDQQVSAQNISCLVKIVKGGYLDGEKIDNANPYESIWTAVGFYLNETHGQPQRLLHNYLLNWITEYPHTRDAKFYYNTWAMQVDGRSKGKATVESMNYNRIFEEIRYAHQMGTEVFILDAGWEKMAGVWTPGHNLERGLGPIFDTLRKYNMELGLWMAPLTVSANAERYKEHPEWIIKDIDGYPVKLGGACIFDFVSGFSDLFIDDCKKLIDQGVTYFKWDAINTYYSYCYDAFHGNKRDAREDVAARYGYLLPIYIERAMTTLMDYNPDVVIEIDLTENARALMGLSTVSAGKLFFMNNGASDYGDYSQYRAKSVRAVANEYNGIIPLQVFTYYNYPQNSYPFMAQRYNVNSSLVCGGGLWGNLALMSNVQRDRINKTIVEKAKEVTPFLRNASTTLIGRVGASPEIYTTVDSLRSVGQVVAFSGSAIHYVHKVPLNGKAFLGVLNNAFKMDGDTLNLLFQFPAADESREAFILPDQKSGIHIISCSTWLGRLLLQENKLELTCGAPGTIVINWPKRLGTPNIQGKSGLRTQLASTGDFFRITIHVPSSEEVITIE